MTELQEKKERVSRCISRIRKRVPVLARGVFPIYKLLDWKWEKGRVPTDKEIAKALYSLVDDLRNTVKGRKIFEVEISSGGLGARIQEFPDGHGEVEIYFKSDEVDGF